MDNGRRYAALAGVSLTEPGEASTITGEAVGQMKQPEASVTDQAISSESKPTETAFYSWQSDLPNSTNRGFVSDCLDKAIKALNKSGSTVLEADRDTQGVSGTPGIAETIFEKIDQCRAFIADVSIINADSESRRTPNPNVLVELGYAAKAVGWERIICVANSAYGAVEELPFDLRGRRVLGYKLAKGEDKTSVREELKAKLQSVLGDVLSSSPQSAPELVRVSFADSDTEEVVGPEMPISFCRVDGVDADALPDYGLPQTVNFGGQSISLPSASTFNANREYYRDMGRHLLMSFDTVPVMIAVSNAGGTLLTGVRLVIDITPIEDTLLLESIVEPPEKQLALAARVPKELFGGPITIDKKRTRSRVTIEYGKIQIGETALSPKFFLGAREDGPVRFEGHVYLDQAPPQTCSLQIDASVTKRTKTNDDLLELIDKYEELFDPGEDNDDGAS